MRLRLAFRVAAVATAVGSMARLLGQRPGRRRTVGHPPEARPGHDRSLTAAELDALLESLSEGVIVFGPDCRVLRCNTAAQLLLGVDRDAIERWDVATLRALVDAEGDPLAPEFFGVERVFASGAAVRGVIAGTHDGGERRWLEANVAPLVCASGHVDRVVLSLRDVTYRTTHDLEAGAFARRLRQLHDIASAPTGSDRNRIDLALRFVLEELELDQAYLGALDRTTSELVIQNVVARGGQPTYGPGRRYPADKTLIGRVIDSNYVLAAPDVNATRRTYNIDYRDEWQSYIAVAVSFAGQRYGVIGFKGLRVRERPFSPIDIELVQVTGDLIAASIEREEQRARLDALAFYDGLTGLPNRVLFSDRLAQCILAAKRQETRFALLFIDLDGFKNVNDTLGHAAGDTVLRTFAARLTHLAREGDTIARLGGDEFVVLAPHIETKRDAVELAQRIALNTSQTLTMDGVALVVTASIGAALFPDHGVDPDRLLARADAAMFAAKSGANPGVRIALADEDVTPHGSASAEPA